MAHKTCPSTGFAKRQAKAWLIDLLISGSSQPKVPRTLSTWSQDPGMHKLKIRTKPSGSLADGRVSFIA